MDLNKEEVKWVGYKKNKINSLQIIKELYDNQVLNNDARNYIILNCNRLAVRKMVERTQSGTR